MCSVLRPDPRPTFLKYHGPLINLTFGSNDNMTTSETSLTIF